MQGLRLEGSQPVAASLVTIYFPCLSPASHVAWELCWGSRAEELWGSQPWQVPLQFTTAPSPFCFFNLSIGCASCRNFSPSGWQPQQVPAWGGLAAMEKAERQKDTGSSCLLLLLLCMEMLTPFPPFPELIHRCY